jgi:hypothetical protein
MVAAASSATRDIDLSTQAKVVRNASTSVCRSIERENRRTSRLKTISPLDELSSFNEVNVNGGGENRRRLGNRSAAPTAREVVSVGF